MLITIMHKMMVHFLYDSYKNNEIIQRIKQVLSSNCIPNSYYKDLGTVGTSLKSVDLLCQQLPASFLALIIIFITDTEFNLSSQQAKLCHYYFQSYSLYPTRSVFQLLLSAMQLLIYNPLNILLKIFGITNGANDNSMSIPCCNVVVETNHQSLVI